MKVFVFILGGLLLNGCASRGFVPTPLQEGLTLNLSYGMAFERVKGVLQEGGYTLSLADEQAGIIETLPKNIPGEEGGIEHKVLISILIRGDRSSSTVYMRLIVTSDHPGERQTILEKLKALSP